MVMTSLFGRSISRYSPRMWNSPRDSSSGWSAPTIIVALQAPPGRTSIDRESSGTLTSLPPHHAAKDSGVIHASNTASGGAAKVRVTVEPTGSVMGVALLGLCLLLCQVLVECIEAAIPEMPVAIDPVRCRSECDGVQSRGTPLGIAPAGDQARLLQHLQVLRDRGQRHVERRGDVVHRRLASREPREDRPSRRISKRREGPAQLVRGHASTINHVAN